MSWVPILFLAQESEKTKRKKIAQSLLPALVPLATGPRVALAAISADQRERQAEREAANVAQETITAINKAVEKGGNLTDTDVSTLKTLAPVLSRAPEIRTRIIAAAKQQKPLDENEKKTLLDQSVTAIEALLPGTRKLSAEQYTHLEKNAPEFLSTLQQYPEIRKRIVAVGVESGDGGRTRNATEAVKTASKQ